MELPKFMMLDHSDHEEDIFILHTEYPRFVVNLVSEDIEWFDDVRDELEEELSSELEGLIIEADKFYQSEIDKYGQIE